MIAFLGVMTALYFLSVLVALVFSRKAVRRIELRPNRKVTFATGALQQWQ
jgi:hypothetical protein